MKKILRTIRGSGSGGDKEKKDKSKGGSNSKHLAHNKDGPNPLCAAAFVGDIDKASECIKHIGVNSLDEKLGKAPLHFAARGGHLQMIKFLIDEGANPDIECSDGRTPLFSAIEGAHESCANWLIAKGYCTDKQDSTMGSTVLHFAAYYGLPQCFRKIYTIHSHLISVFDKAGKMPIHVAVQAGRDEIVNYICTVHPESCEAKTKHEEQTPLMVAVQQETMNTILLLLEAGCRTDTVDKLGTSADLLAKSRANSEISSLLNQWASQNNIEMTLDRKESNFGNITPSLSIMKNSPGPSVKSQSPPHQFNKSYLLTESKQFEKKYVAEPAEPIQRETAPVIPSAIEQNVESDDDSEWGSNSESDAGQSNNNEDADLKKRISQAFLLPILDKSEENVFKFKSPKKAIVKVSHIDTIEIATEGTLGRDDTMKSVAETLVRNSVLFKSENNEGRPDTHENDIALSEKTVKDCSKKGINSAHELTIKDGKEDGKEPEQDVQPEIITSGDNKEDEVIKEHNVAVEETEVNRPHHTNLNQESDISEWSDGEENKDNVENITSVSEADIDNMLALIDKHNIPVKPKVGKRATENSDSENDSSWDSDALPVPISIVTKIKEPQAETIEEEPVIELSLPLQPEVKSNTSGNNRKENEGAQGDFVSQNQTNYLEEKNEDDDVIKMHTKRWSGVMNELTKRVSTPKLNLVTATSSDNELVTNESATEIDSSAEEGPLPLRNPITTSSIEMGNLPLAETVSSQTCRITSSEIFGEMEASPTPKQDDMETVLFKSNNFDAQDSSREVKMNAPSIFRVLPTDNLNIPMSSKSSSSDSLVPTLSSIPKKLEKNKRSKKDSKLEKSESLVGTADSIPLSSLLNDDLETLKKKMSKKSYQLRFPHGRSDTTRKMSCPENNVPPSFLSKMKSQFTLKKSTRGKSESLPDVHEATVSHFQDAQIEESEMVVCELLNKAKEILQSTAAGKSIKNTKDDMKVLNVAHGDNQRDASNNSSNEGDDCCDDQYPGLQGTYRSFQQPALPLPSSRYCDSVTPGVSDPFVIKEVLKDLSCVIDKTYGTNVTLRGRSTELEAELERLRCELQCCQSCKGELENEMLKLQADFKQAQYALDEITAAKASLEMIVAQLREQVMRQQQQLDSESEEKSRLLAIVKELEMKLDDIGTNIGQIEMERNDLFIRVQEHEEFQNVSARSSGGRIAELEEALIRCCRQNDTFQSEIDNLRSEISEMRAQIDTLQYEKKQIMGEFDYARESWSNEKGAMKCTIADLQRRLESCEANKMDICQKMNAIVAEHHTEMDKLSEEALKYKDINDDLNEEIETLRKQLKDCEENKRNNSSSPQRETIPSNLLAQLNEDVTKYKNGNEGLHKELEVVRKRLHDSEELQHNNFRQLTLLKQSNEDSAKYKDLCDTLNKELETLRRQLHLSEEELQNNNLLIGNEDLNKELEVVRKRLHDSEELQHNNLRQLTLLKQSNEDSAKYKDLCDTLNKELDTLRRQLHVSEEELQNNNLQIREMKISNSSSLMVSNQPEQVNNELKKLTEKIQLLEAEKCTLENLVKSKDRLEAELKDLKRTIDDQYVDKTELERLRAAYDNQIATMKSQYEQQVQFGIDRNNEITQIMDQQAKDRIIIDQIRESHETLLRAELSTMKKMNQVEIENLKRLISEQEELNKSEVASRRLITEKLSGEMNSAREAWSTKKASLKAIIVELQRKLVESKELQRKDSQHKSIHQQTEMNKLHEDATKYKDLCQVLNEELKSLRKQLKDAENYKKYDGQRENSLIHNNEALKREIKKMNEQIQLYEAEKITLENLVRSKDRLEVDLKNLKRAISDQYVDKTELERLRAAYDNQIVTVKAQYEQQVQLGIDRKYSEITQIMDLQARDRMMIDQIRESNENILRTELSTTKKSSNLEIDNLKRQVREQEEQIKSEVTSRRLITEKFSTEKKRNEDLLRKLQLLSTARSETLLAFGNNNSGED